MKNLIILLTISLLIFNAGFAQKNPNSDKNEYKHSIETSPLSPLLQAIDKGIWGLKYDYALTPNDEVKFGFTYMNISFDIGTTNSAGILVGYRRYLWKRLYAEYELWPGYDKFYENNEDKYYKGFDLWNEFRVGYQFNFEIREFPLFVNVAWPFGFGLYSTNKPDSFYDRMNQSFSDKYFFHFPLVFVGCKF